MGTMPLHRVRSTARPASSCIVMRVFIVYLAGISHTANLSEQSQHLVMVWAPQYRDRRGHARIHRAAGFSFAPPARTLRGLRRIPPHGSNIYSARSGRDEQDVPIWCRLLFVGRRIGGALADVFCACLATLRVRLASYWGMGRQNTIYRVLFNCSLGMEISRRISPGMDIHHAFAAAVCAIGHSSHDFGRELRGLQARHRLEFGWNGHCGVYARMGTLGPHRWILVGTSCG